MCDALDIVNLPKPESPDDVRAMRRGAATSSIAPARRGNPRQHRVAARLSPGRGDRDGELARGGPAGRMGRLDRAARHRPLQPRDDRDVPAAHPHRRGRGGRVGLRRRVRELQGSPRATSARRKRRAAWATSARAASIRRRCRSPTRCSVPPTRRSRIRSRWSRPRARCRAKGIGAFTVNGRMVDGPFVRRAEADPRPRAQAGDHSMRSAWLAAAPRGAGSRSRRFRRSRSCRFPRSPSRSSCRIRRADRTTRSRASWASACRTRGRSR